MRCSLNMPLRVKFLRKKNLSEMGFHEKNGLRYYQFDIFADQPVFHAVFTRHGGFSQPPFDRLNTGGTVGDEKSAVVANHEKIYATFGYDYESRFDVWQVHGTRILSSDTPRDVGTPHQKADGILTDNPDVTLFMRFADCVPILLMDPVHKVIGIVHAGWQGTYQKIAKHAIREMVLRYHSNPKAILAAIGPSICQACYEVGEDVYRAFLKSFGESAQRFFKDRAGKRLLDLWQPNQETLLEAGVQQIESANICTACHLEDWYSHRAENGNTGRFGVLMSLENPS